MSQYPPTPRPPYKQSPQGYQQSHGHSRYNDFAINHFRSFNYLFENPNWLVNVLFVGIGLFVPLVGPVAVYGYMCEVIAVLHQSRGARYPDFSTERINEYLSRGIWPALVMIICGVVLAPILWITVVGWMAVIGMFGGPIILLISIPFLMMILMCIWTPISLFITPVLLRAGFSKDFGYAMNFPFALQFAGNVWQPFVLSAVIIFIASMVCTVVGLAMVCIGVYLTMAYIFLVHAHATWQFYELHLSRGGEPVYFKP